MDRDLPVHFGGLGVCIPADVCNQQYQFSKELLHGVVALLLGQQSLLLSAVVHHQNELFKHLTTLKNQSLSDHSRLVVSHCPSHLRWAVECCQLLPGFQPFLWTSMVSHSIRVSLLMPLCLCYDFAPPNLPSCGKDFCVPRL